MKPQLNRSKIIVKKSPIHGYGVFADQNFTPGEVIEEAYTLIVNYKEMDLLDYYFGLEKDVNKKTLLPLGYACIYNHSEQHNAVFKFDIENKLTIFKAIRKIKPGEEITVYYSPCWFAYRSMSVKKPSLIYRIRHMLPPIFLRFTVVAGTLLALTILLAKFKPILSTLSILPTYFF